MANNKIEIKEHGVQKDVLNLIKKAKRERWDSLDLSDRQLTSIPPEIGSLTALISLHLWGNQLTSLPPEIGNLTALTRLDLWGNQLTSLPPEIVDLIALTNLDLVSNQLTSLPPEIGNLTALTNLDLVSNQLTSLPPEIGNLTALTSLGLANNQFASLPPEIGNLTALTSLDLANNQFASLPPEIGNLTALTSLDLANNQFESLPPEIIALSTLTELDLRDNQLTSLPPEIGNLTALTSLDLANNQFESLPPEIIVLSTLTELDLRDNQLTSLPPEIGNLTALTSLGLANNQFASLPPEIGNLTVLTSLDLRGNQLTSLPPEIGNLTALTSLHLRDSQLTSLPPEIGNLTALISLDLANNQFVFLPPEIIALSTLTELVLRDNQLTSLPPEIGNLTALTSLDLRDNQLTSLPPEIGNLTALTSLDLWGNLLTSLPSEIVNLTALTNLDLVSNQLTSLLPGIFSLTTLTSLDLWGNQLTSLPLEIGNLTALTNLDLANNQLTSLPPEIGNLTALNSLDLASNQLTSLPPEIGNLTALTSLYLWGNQFTSLPLKIGNLTALNSLDLRDNQLTSLPPEIVNLTTLISLDLWGNRLTSLPPEIGNLTALTSLDLGSNQLTSLPPEIGNVTALTNLDLASNQLTSLPPEIGNVTALNSLDLRGNQLTSLPPEIANLTALNSLDLASNQLTSLPPEIVNLSTLTELDLSSNQFASLPPEIVNLCTLTELDLSSNQLTFLPSEIGKLKNLFNFSVDENPLPAIYYDTLEEGGFKSLANLLREIEYGADLLFEAKLLITGEGRVGKSWALAALQGKNPQQAIGDQTTYGVDRSNLIIPHPKQKDVEINFNCWDFGGQDVYRITHQFFYSVDAVYLLVWKPLFGADRCQVREWLRRIKTRAGDRAKVIMVASHSPIDDRPYAPDYNYANLPEDLQKIIVGSIAIDSETGDNISELRDMIAIHSVKLPRMGDPIPSSWKNARDRVLEIQKIGDTPYMYFSSFTEICKIAGITNINSVYTLAKVYLHHLGRASYYGERALPTKILTPDNDAANHSGFIDVQIADILVLDAEWLSKAFVQVLEDKITRDAGGILDHKRLDDIWTNHRRKEWHVYQAREYEFLIRLMHKFDMSYVVKGGSGNKSLIGQLTPDKRPDFEWDNLFENVDHSTHRLICKIDNEISGLMERFIVRTFAYHVFENGQGLFWRNGVFLKEDIHGNKALATVSGTEKPVFTIEVIGPQPGWFLGELHRELVDILDFWPGLKWGFRVACPTKPSEKRFCDGSFKFNFLKEEFNENPEGVHACEECRIRRTPGELLFGFRGITETNISKIHEYSLASEQAPVPRIFTIVPIDFKKYDPRSAWKSFVSGQKYKVTLYSEYSYKAVLEKEITINPEWAKFLGPVARITAFALSGAAIPTTGEAADQLNNAIRFMEVIEGVTVDDGEKIKDIDRDKEDLLSTLSRSQSNKMLEFYDELGFAPDYGGLVFAKVSNPRGYRWMTEQEKVDHAEEPISLVS